MDRFLIDTGWYCCTENGSFKDTQKAYFLVKQYVILG